MVGREGSEGEGLVSNNFLSKNFIFLLLQVIFYLV